MLMVDKNSISDMERFLSILNGTPQAPARNTTDNTKNAIPNSSDSDKDAMKKILQAFYSVGDTAINDGMEIKEVRDAYQTEKTPTGIKIGNWFVDCIHESKSKKIYNIREEMTNINVFSDLSLYEAALAIVEQLRNGNDENSSVVKHILSLENDYSKYLNDAIIYGQILRSKTINETRRMIIEDKYEAAKYKAINIKNQIKIYS